jgi:NADPH-dependent 2,4-dienoyl-CoA reductase/sulfur reductase-like enzyme/nitrite reductase/ring-hydroxylating ferredoxin subunit
MRAPEKTPRPDLTQGLSLSRLADGRTLVGTVGEDEVLLARVGDEIFAVGSHCTHYRGALADGLLVGDTIRCPLHHACFNLRTGDAVRAPALDPIACWRVERQGDTVFVHEKRPASPGPRPTEAPSSVVIVGGGGAGLAAAEMLRREQYAGPITLISADADPPVDRPNLSKDYLAGEAQEDWIPLEPAAFYKDHQIDLLLGTPVTAIHPNTRTVVLADGQSRTYGALLLATGAAPVRLTVPGADGPHVHYLRSFADSKAIVAAAQAGARAVVVGASFIGLEVAAALRARKVHVDVVAPDDLPLSKVLGPSLGHFVQGLHEKQGVVFHLRQTVTSIAGRVVSLSGGRSVEADFVVVGIGVRPLVELAEHAGLSVDRGILVNEFLETGVPGIFAAGDVARWHDWRSGEHLRVEHWVVALRQGQVAARNMLGRREPFRSAPFFWSQHYDTTIRYVGHSGGWEAVELDGDPAEACRASFRRAGHEVAVATINRDLDGLEAEVALERAPH